MSDAESEEPALWIDYLPIDVQIRIATYVSDGKSGLDALNLAKASPCQPHAVSTALEHTLERTFIEHKDGLVEDWTEVFVDVRILQLHEHPPNFSLLYSPFLKLVVVEDEPIQLDALSRSGVSFDRLELSLPYGTPANVICRYLRHVNFRKFDLYSNDTHFWLNVETDDLVAACEGVKAVYLHDHFWTTNGVAAFLNGLKTLHELTIDLRGTGNLLELESVMMRLKRMRIAVWDTQLSEIIHLAAKTKTVLKRIRIYSLGGTDEEALLTLGEDVPEVQKMEKLRIVLSPGGELHFPRLSNLSNLDLRWDRNADYFEDSDPFYQPPHGAIFEIVQRHPSLQSLKLFEVRLPDEEIMAIIARLGTRLTRFGLSLVGQDVPPHQRLLTVLKSLSRHCSNLVELDLRYYMDWYNCKTLRLHDRFTNSLKREVLFYLNRLQRQNANLNLEDTEDAVVDFLDHDMDHDMEESEKERATELRRALALRRCRRALNEVGNGSHVAEMAQLLETGCDGLKQDLDAAVQAYRKAVCMGDHEAILKLWALTDQKTSDFSEPVPGGALELMLELEKKEKNVIRDFADTFLERTRMSDSPNYRATAKVMRLAISRGHVQRYAKELAKLLEKGYEDVPPDPESAIELYRSVVDESCGTDALFWWAEWVYEGYGNQQPDPAGARTILESGVSGNCAACINFLGVIVQEGYGETESNPEEAIKLFQRAIDQGSTSAMVNLGMLYARGFGGYTPNPEKAIELFSKAVADDSLTPSKHLLDQLISEDEDSEKFSDCYCDQCEEEDSCFWQMSAPLPNLSTYGFEDHPPNQKEAIRMYNEIQNPTWSVLWHRRVHSRFAKKEVSAIRLPDIGSHRLVLFKIPRDLDTQLFLTCSL